MTPDNQPLPEDYYLKYDGPDEFVKGEQIERIPLVNTDKTWDANYEEALNIYLSEDINYGANTIKNADVEDLKQLASDSFYKGYNVAMEENTCLRKLIEKAFHEGWKSEYTSYDWEQFKKDNGL